MPKKMYVIQADDGMFYCGLKYWDNQLRKAQIYHSLLYAGNIVKDYEKRNCKIIEVSLAIVPQTKTTADRIRSMTDEELADFVQRMIDVGDTSEVYCPQKPECFDLVDSEDGIPQEMCRKCLLGWLRQPAEEVTHE